MDAGTTTLEPENDEVARQRQAVLDKNPNVSGARETSVQQADYFGGDVTFKYFFPDGVTYIEHKKLMEGELKRLRNGSNRDIEINRKTQNAKMRLAAGDDRAMLLEVAVVGWNLKRSGEPVPVGKVKANTLDLLDPTLVDGLVKDINKQNPALNAEVTADDIREEIKNLEEMLAEKEKEEAGEPSS